MQDILKGVTQLVDLVITKVVDLKIPETMGSFFPQLAAAGEIYTLLTRWIFPVLAVVILLRCVRPLLQDRNNNAVWGHLQMKDGTRLPLRHWENSIGRSRLSDLVLDFPFISRSHAVLTFRQGAWSVADLNSKNGVKVNGVEVEQAETVEHGDTISLGGLELELDLTNKKSSGNRQQNDRSKPESMPAPPQSSPAPPLPSPRAVPGSDPAESSMRPTKPGVHGSSIEKNKSAGRSEVDTMGKSAARGEARGQGKPGSRGKTGRGIRPGKKFNAASTLLLILLFQLLGALQLCFSMGDEVNPAVPLTFCLFILAQILHYGIMRLISRNYIEFELLCYFLCGLSLFVVASAAPGALFKQLGAIVGGMTVYTVLGLMLRDLGQAGRLKYLFIAVALVLLVLNLVMGETRFGAKRWIDLGLITFQPSEFVKIAFVLAGTATLDKLLTTRDMTAFIVFASVCIGVMVLIRDFGTVLVFFGAFIVIAFMRSGDLRTIAFALAGAALGSVAAVSFMPYIASRIATWGNVWEYASTSGYQQTRTLIAAASGGLLGVGGGHGYLAQIAAADTDLIFGILCEEWGLVVALTAVSIMVFYAFYAVLLTRNCRSSFYAIASCGAAAIFLLQTALNVLGSVDILPFTGLTVPFISRGGSSMVASWGLLALIQSADERGRPGKAGFSGKKKKRLKR